MTGGAPQTSFGQHITGGNMPIPHLASHFSQQATSNPFPQMANQFTQQQQYQQQQPVMNQFQQQPQQQQQPFYNQFQLQPNLNQMTNMFQNTSISSPATFNQQIPTTTFGQQPQFEGFGSQPLQSQPTGMGFEMHHCNHNLRGRELIYKQQHQIIPWILEVFLVLFFHLLLLKCILNLY